LNPHPHTPQRRPASTISPQLRADRNFGDLELLAADIADRGLRHPVSVTRGGKLILGARRYAACALAGVDHVSCWLITSVPDALAVIRWENADDLDSGDVKFHLPATIRALAAQDMAMRELSWWPRGDPGGPTTGRLDHRAELTAALFSPGESGFINAAQYRQLHGLVLAAAGWQSGPGGAGRLAVSAAARRSARQALTMLDHRDTRVINAIYSRWRDEMPLTHPEMKPLKPDDVDPFIAVIAGFASALAATGVPDQDTPDAQFRAIDGALSEAIRALGHYRKTLRQARLSAG
jgi:hypothetical protein